MTRKDYNDCVDRLADGLYRFALRYTGDGESSRDAVQDSFVALWEHRSEVEAAGAKAYLMRVLYRKLVDLHRHQSRYHRGVQPDRPVGGHDTFELGDAIQQALDTLPEVQRSLVLLRDLEGYTYKELATTLGISEQQVMVYLYRARTAMKKILSNDLNKQPL